MCAPRRFALPLLVALGLLAGAHAARADPDDPTFAILQRIDEFLHRGEGPDGVTRDPRNLRNPPEEIRLSVVPQLLGYCELYRLFPHTTAYRDIVDRADFLLAHMDEATSGSSFDGMLALGFLEAHAVTGDPRYRAAAEPFLARFRGMGFADMRLNWGLMAAMALAEDARATGNPLSLRKVHDILLTVAREQNLDGSFPHYCRGTRDVHYSAWMAMELILVGERVTDPELDVLLAGLDRFLGGRVDPAGTTRYQEVGPLGRAVPYYSLGYGCADYDTRGWTNELGYTAMLFDHFQDARYHGVAGRLRDLQDGGGFADKWGYMPDPLDPIFPWASESRSVIRTSVVFWSLASLEAARMTHVPVQYDPATAGAPNPDEVAADPGSGEGVPTAAMDPGSVDHPADEDDLAAWVAREAPAAVLAPDPSPAAAERAATVTSAPPGGAAAEGTRNGAAGLGEAAWPSPDSFALGPATPNPTAGSCAFLLRLPREADVRLRILDGSGRLVRDLSPGPLPAGTRVLHWDGRDRAGSSVPIGLYWLDARAGGWRAALRLVVTR